MKTPATKSTPTRERATNKSNPTRNRNLNNEAPASSSKIKKRIRDIKRTMSKPDLSAELLISSKRKLRALEFELGEKLIDEQERANATKYHKVKFMERKKTQRKLKQAKKDLEAASEENKAAAQNKVDELEIKMLYVNHYPKTLSYVSLYPTSNEDDAKSVSRKNKLLKDIKEALLAGDKDMKLLLKRYRNDYKEKLIKRGDIQPEAPVDDEDMKQESKPDEKVDDFFEK